MGAAVEVVGAIPPIRRHPLAHRARPPFDLGPRPDVVPERGDERIPDAMCVGNAVDEDEGAELENELFIPDGHSAEFPADWGNPEAALRQSQFWTIFEACLDRLPAKPGRVFMMREFLDLDTEEICKELKISSSNCWVLLHRARMALQLCLDKNWFAR